MQLFTYAFSFEPAVAPLNVKTTLNVKSNAKCRNAKCEKHHHHYHCLNHVFIIFLFNALDSDFFVVVVIIIIITLITWSYVILEFSENPPWAVIRKMGVSWYEVWPQITARALIRKVKPGRWASNPWLYQPERGSRTFSRYLLVQNHTGCETI